MEIQGNNSWNEKKSMWLLLLTVVIILAGYQLFIRNRVFREGVYVKCKIIKSEGRKGGITTTLNYTYKGKAHVGRISTEWKPGIGEEYFIKLLPTDPDAIVFLEDNPVPECLININTPFEGWKELPVCVTKN